MYMYAQASSLNIKKQQSRIIIHIHKKFSEVFVCVITKPRANIKVGSTLTLAAYMSSDVLLSLFALLVFLQHLYILQFL